MFFFPIFFVQVIKCQQPCASHSMKHTASKQCSHASTSPWSLYLCLYKFIPRRHQHTLCHAMTSIHPKWGQIDNPWISGERQQYPDCAAHVLGPHTSVQQMRTLHLVRSFVVLLIARSLCSYMYICTSKYTQTNTYIHTHTHTNR
jgi:hypothetical protein